MRRYCSKCGSIIEYDEKNVTITIEQGKTLCDECIEFLRGLK